MINYIALIVALALSAVSGYYSIIGLTTIFASTFWPVIFMGSTLEIAKLVTASWLYHNWDIAKKNIKIYLTLSLIILMIITSMGVFGFLSKSHIDQTVKINSGGSDILKEIVYKIKIEEDKISDIDKQIGMIDNAVTKMVEKGQASSSLKANDQQRKKRDELTKTKQTHIDNKIKLNQEKIRLESDQRKLEAEVGPIKYIAEFFTDNADNKQLERAVSWMIILIIIVFDPLAVVLLIAANYGLYHRKYILFQNDKSIKVDKNKLMSL